MKQSTAIALVARTFRGLTLDVNTMVKRNPAGLAPCRLCGDSAATLDVHDLPAHRRCLQGR